MSEVLPQGKNPDWGEVVERYAWELQASSNGEDEGSGRALVDYVESGVFEDETADPGELYEAMADSPHRQVQLKAYAGLKKLAAYDPELADRLRPKLMVVNAVELVRQAYLKKD